VCYYFTSVSDEIDASVLREFSFHTGSEIRIVAYWISTTAIPPGVFFMNKYFIVKIFLGE